MIFLLTWLTESAKPLGTGVLQSQGTQRFRRDQRASGTVRNSHQLPADFPEANHRFIMIHLFFKWFPQLSVHLVAVQPQEKTGPNVLVCLGRPHGHGSAARSWIMPRGPVKMRCPAWTLGPLRHRRGRKRMWLGARAGVECQEENHGEHRIFDFGIYISWGGLNMGYNLRI